jgi:hypothetical protein
MTAFVNMDAMLEAVARAYDEEDSAQRGEPSPWRADLVESYKQQDGELGWETWRQERLACARAALKAIGMAS